MRKELTLVLLEATFFLCNKGVGKDSILAEMKFRNKILKKLKKL